VRKLRFTEVQMEWHSSGRRIASRFLQLPSGIGSASRRSTLGGSGSERSRPTMCGGISLENARLKNRVWCICQIAFNSDPFSSPVAAPLSWVGWGYPCSALEGHGRRHAFHRAGDARADQGLLA
jgi:hypothetical protein